MKILKKADVVVLFEGLVNISDRFSDMAEKPGLPKGIQNQILEIAKFTMDMAIDIMVLETGASDEVN